MQVAGSSLLGSTRVSQRLLGSLIRLTAAAQSSDSRQLGLRAVLCLVSSTRDAVTDVHARAPGTGTAEALSASVHANGQPAVSVSSQPGSSTSDSRDITSLLAGRGADVLQLALGTASAGKQAVLNSEDMEDDEPAGDVARSAQEAGAGELDTGGAPGSEEKAGEETEILMLQLQVGSSKCANEHWNSKLVLMHVTLNQDDLWMFMTIPMERLNAMMYNFSPK